jgi:hypothetical protein
MIKMQKNTTIGVLLIKVVYVPPVFTPNSSPFLELYNAPGVATPKIHLLDQSRSGALILYFLPGHASRVTINSSAGVDLGLS